MDGGDIALSNSKIYLRHRLDRGLLRIELWDFGIHTNGYFQCSHHDNLL